MSHYILSSPEGPGFKRLTTSKNTYQRLPLNKKELSTDFGVRINSRLYIFIIFILNKFNTQENQWLPETRCQCLGVLNTVWAKSLPWSMRVIDCVHGERTSFGFCDHAKFCYRLSQRSQWGCVKCLELDLTGLCHVYIRTPRWTK